MHSDEQGNTKPLSSPTQRSRGWSFTLNNYSDEDYELLKAHLHSTSLKYVIGKEVGEKGTPHLQGYCYYKNPQTLTHMKKINSRIHWERSLGSPEQNLTYCSKDGNFTEHGMIPLKEKIKQKLLNKYKTVVWKPWQQKVLDIIDEEPDSRTINWIYDKIGNSGKSFLTKYLALTHELIIADGKKDNILHQVHKKLNEEEKEFRIVLLDIPRSSEGYINYGVLEQLKNGIIYSGKYEGGLCLFDNVHVFVFANFYPNTDEFSEDRWNIIDIGEN